MELVSKELNEKAIELANKSLAKGFDWQAFLVLSLAQQNLESLLTPINNVNITDYVEDSNVDENIQLFLNQFIHFSKLKSQNVSNENIVQELNILLSYFKKIITELFYSSENTEEREVIKNFLSSMKLG